MAIVLGALVERVAPRALPLGVGSTGFKSPTPKRARSDAFHRVFDAFHLARHGRCVTVTSMSADANSPAGGPEHHGFGRRPNHQTPWWVPTDAVFHIRIRIAPGAALLTEPSTAGALLESVRFYSERRRWHFAIFLLMPDHCHALLAFPADRRMTRVIGDWKHWHTTHTGLQWQENFFDHRMRNDAEWEEKFRYIRNNPVVKGLCKRPGDWPWQIIGTDDDGRPLDASRLDR